MTSERKKSLLFYGLISLAFLLIFELSLRSYLSIAHNAPFWRPFEQIQLYYDRIQEVSTAEEQFDILLLGGSVLTPGNGTIEAELKRHLANKKVKIHNVSQNGHNSLDSRYKLDYLKNEEFDLVLFYHAINEVRTNNCPPEVFKESYDHYAWYALINVIMRHPKMNISVIPYTFDFLWMRLKQVFKKQELVPPHAPKAEWLEYGKDLKSTASFKKNLEAIVNHEATKQTLLIEYASYLPEDYSLEKFNNKTLDYRSHFCAVEIWGTVENVMNGITAHNNVLKNVAQNNDLYFYSMQDSILKSRETFDDICHLTEKGSAEFVQRILPIIKKSIDEQQ